MKFLRVVILVVIVAVVLGGIALLCGWLPNPFANDASPGEERPAAEATHASEEGAEVRYMGWLEPAWGVINVSGPPADRLDRLNKIAEDSEVEEGRVLALLASRQVKQLQVEMLDCQIKEATARRDAESLLAQTHVRSAELEKEKIGLQASEAASLERKIDLLKANLTLAKKDYQRLSNLRGIAPPGDESNEVVSQQELERQQLVVNRAETELAATETDLAKLRAGHALSIKAADADLIAAQASQKQAMTAVPVESLVKQREIAQADLDQTAIKAPCKGTVLKIFVREGEAVGQRPILRMANLDRMVTIVEVYEVDAKRVQVGQTAIVTSAAFHAPYDKTGLKGEVVRIESVVNTPELRSVDPYAKVDRHVIPVRIQLDKEGSAEAAHFVDLQVEVKIRTAAETKGSAKK